MDERSAKKGGNRTDDPARKRIKDDNARIMGSRVIRVDHLAANRGEKKKKRGGEINEERLRATSCQILSLNPSDGSSNSPPSIPPSNRLAIVFVPSRVYAARRRSVVADRYIIVDNVCETRVEFGLFAEGEEVRQDEGW